MFHNKKSIAALVISICSALYSTSAATEPTSHIHIKHLIKSWPAAPQAIGLLPIAIKEAAIASLYIKLARIHDQDLNWIKSHIKQAQYALKANPAEEGGQGYGLIKAAYAIARETKLAAANQASINVKLQSKAIIMSAYNTAAVAKKMARICNKIANTFSIAQALSYIDQLEILAITLLEGEDLDKDGQITSFNHEGGLNLARDKLTFMARTAGIIKLKKP
ncbi:MAG: hypothetical protein OFPII_18660 [Osedax symbiont Rs1]|nr:MAG: hypothetical protein OFPII_18660 [Osedax symbiont Rs1]